MIQAVVPLGLFQGGQIDALLDDTDYIVAAIRIGANMTGIIFGYTETNRTKTDFIRCYS